MKSLETKASRFSKAYRIVLPLLIIMIGGGAAAYFKATSPTIKKTPPKQKIPAVEVTTAKKKKAQQILKVMGTVSPAREINLRARVSGEITFISPDFLPGGHISKGEILLKIDASDYQIDVDKAETAVVSARAALAIEKGSQTIAREELRLLSETSVDVSQETDLALRRPQLQQAKATLNNAKADLLKAKLNLERTTLRAPFNLLVTTRSTNLGSHVSTQDILATLVGTDEYWIKATVPIDQLKAINMMGPKGGSTATVQSQGATSEWDGQVIHTTGSLDENSRMASLIITVPDPLGLKKRGDSMPLMLDDYVTVTIYGKTIPEIITLPRIALRDNNTLWILDKGRLNIKNVGISWKQDEQIFIDEGIHVGDTIILSNISMPVNGMRLSISDSSAREKSAEIARLERTE